MITKRNAWHPEEVSLLDKGLDRGWSPDKISRLLSAYGYTRKSRCIYARIESHGLRRGFPQTVKPCRVPTAAEWADYIEQLLPFLP